MLQENYDIEVEWRAFELHPEVPPDGTMLPAHLHSYFKAMRQRLEFAAADVGMEIAFSDFIPNSRRALEAAEYAREKGKHQEFHKVVFRKIYGEAQNIGSWDVLRAAAEEIGLDADEMQTETENGNYEDAVANQIREAYSIGVTGVPTYIVDQRYAIVGAQPYEAFEQLMAQIEAEAASALSGD